MNADRTDTRSPHLDLEDLIAEVTGQAIPDRAREHLGTCEHCLVEASRWDVVADGVRVLAAVAPQVAQPARPVGTGPQVPDGPGRRSTLAASVAAALVLLGGAGYGAAAALTGHAPGTAGKGTKTTARAGAKATALTAVSGCAGLKQADGTLEQVNGGSLVIKTASGQKVTVTTTSSTTANVFAAPLSDITDGTQVTVAGRSSGGSIAADSVSVGSPFKVPVRGNVKFDLLPGYVGVLGTVADASAAGFTVLTSSGTRVPVSTSHSTVVHLDRASLSQFQLGASTVAAGYVGPGGTLSATVVLQPSSGSGGKAGSNPQLDLGGCSPASIDAAYASAYGS